MAYIEMRCAGVRTKRGPEGVPVGGQLCNALLFRTDGFIVEVVCAKCGETMRFSVVEMQIQSAMRGDGMLEIGHEHLAGFTAFGADDVEVDAPAVVPERPLQVQPLDMVGTGEADTERARRPLTLDALRPIRPPAKKAGNG